MARLSAASKIELKHATAAGVIRRLGAQLPLRSGSPPAARARYGSTGRHLAGARSASAPPVKAQPAVLSAEMSAHDAFRAVIRASLAHLRANEHGMLESVDPEYLHQMRVASRRLRSALSVFAPLFPRETIAPMAAELKWLAGALGPARDWDVFMAETLPPVRAEFGDHAALTAFIRQCAGLRRAAGRKARRAVASQRYRRMAQTLAGDQWLLPMDEARRATLCAPVREFAGVVLEKRYDRVRKRGWKLRQLSSTQLHRLRIVIKKFRYATDFFAGLHDEGRARDTLQRLARLQNILGAINDAATAGNLVGEVLHGASSRYAAEARGILLGWSRGRAATLRRELKTAWKSFRAAERFW